MHLTIQLGSGINNEVSYYSTKCHAILLALSSICALFADAFATSAPTKGRGRNFFGIISKATTAASSQGSITRSCITATSTPPSWDELSDALRNDITCADDDDKSQKPLVTLYRDTNGWCPFCERVWLVLLAKGIPYEEQLISLQNKPDWHKALVPTSLVPAVLFHGDNSEEGKKNERRIVWESSDIINALEEEFPDTPKMLPHDNDNPEYDAAVQMNDDLSSCWVCICLLGGGMVRFRRKTSWIERPSSFRSWIDSTRHYWRILGGGSALAWTLLL